MLRNCFTCLHWQLLTKSDSDYYVGFRILDGYGICRRQIVGSRVDGIRAVAAPQSLGDDTPDCRVTTGPAFGCIHHLTGRVVAQEEKAHELRINGAEMAS